MKHFKSPLNIYVLWHPSYEKDVSNNRMYGGTEIANFIYSSFCRKVDNPLERTFGIPIYFRSTQDKDGYPSPINEDEAERNAFVVLAEGNMLNDKSYRTYLKNLVDNRRGSDRIFLFQLDKYGYAVNDQLPKSLYVDLSREASEYWEQEFRQRTKVIYGHLLHDLSRMLFSMVPSNEAERDDSNKRKPPVRLFLSHTKRDGESQVNDFRNHVQGETKLDTFFDLHDIMTGENLEDEIQLHMDSNTAVVIFQTDEFSNGEWCRNEVLWAKKRSTPMVVINDIQKGERRSFPYMGNVPTVRWSHNYPEILNLVLGQVLHQRFWKMLLETLTDYHGLNEKYKCHHLGRSPELFDLVGIKSNKESGRSNLIIYPDPPLGVEEFNFLREARFDLDFTTPISLINI